MSQSTITLSADDELLARATRAARAGGSDLESLLLSALTSIAELDPAHFDESKLPPITRSALGLAKRGPSLNEERAALEEALEEKYGIGREDRT